MQIDLHMYSWKRDRGRNASSHGDGPDMSNKAVADPPSVTTNPLQSSNKFDSVVLLIFGVVMRYGRYKNETEDIFIEMLHCNAKLDRRWSDLICLMIKMVVSSNEQKSDQQYEWRCWCSSGTTAVAPVSITATDMHIADDYLIELSRIDQLISGKQPTYVNKREPVSIQSRAVEA
ncbi:hypothetical protein T4D_9607 [Trichinella pseudospiralis]|uniref:Uncharacterized protein n=1 Tax=Trichinella pseudospiralis TaxID=6337 RepID=A0A0V1FK21_TRIPS|nr:hypothetical protein T4D_9607 [Trichinella pseudospiralis]